ncbi:MAG: sulfite exporter TauE/SafE family protein [Rhodothermales bacterium]
MPDVTYLGIISVALLMGLAGSAHCVGMCGGFAVLAGSGATRSSKTHRKRLAWLGGKTVTYAALGMALGLAGDAVPRSFSGFQSIVVVLTAILLVLTGLHMAGIGPSWSLFAPSPVSAFVTRMSALVKKSSTAGRFALGLLNGLLPCGLVYAALAYSLTYQSGVKGALFMAIFGLGTAPVLVLIGLGTGVFSHKYRATMTRVVGWVVVLLGFYTMMRLPAFMNGQ